MLTYTLLNRREYLKTLADTVDHVTRDESVYITAMAFNPREPLVALLMRSLCQAAKRGAHVVLLIDAINFLQYPNGIPGPLFYAPSAHAFRGIFADIQSALDTLKEVGGTYYITNMPKRRFTIPVTGRSHIKAAAVGNQVFVGGCNLEEPKQLDVMVSWHDAMAAATIHNWLASMAASENTRQAFNDVDTKTPLDSTTSLILDAGVPGQSLIYDTALELIDTAHEWLYITCQFFPGGPVARHLAAAAARGVRVTVDYSHPHVHGIQAPIHHFYELYEHSQGIPPQLFTSRLGKHTPKLHAKILVSEKEAMVGSHNYVPQGVQFGTAELALHSTDAAFGVHLRTFITEQITVAQQTAHSARPVPVPQEQV
jgi:phosphatidylserine/phosphatidylglycerophosphate/cardiolipin synthase-like enzyme